MVLNDEQEQQQMKVTWEDMHRWGAVAPGCKVQFVLEDWGAPTGTILPCGNIELDPIFIGGEPEPPYRTLSPATVSCQCQVVVCAVRACHAECPLTFPLPTPACFLHTSQAPGEFVKHCFTLYCRVKGLPATNFGQPVRWATLPLT